ncbi:hypothetical protein EYF80_049545 [Liparis tanakae]|uniref:Uncharacterized protein n=1 Tax=Liparis tanakae TaxID=230148 RepID=A0A4Z2FGJ2_9TELE|nr:hypothetical protein EYF80_049545 [Liparis tanakae]
MSSAVKPFTVCSTLTESGARGSKNRTSPFTLRGNITLERGGAYLTLRGNIPVTTITVGVTGSTGYSNNHDVIAHHSLGPILRSNTRTEPSPRPATTRERRESQERLVTQESAPILTTRTSPDVMRSPVSCSQSTTMPAPADTRA